RRDRKSGDRIFRIQEIRMPNLMENPASKLVIRRRLHRSDGCRTFGPWRGTDKGMPVDHLSAWPAHGSNLPEQLVGRRSITVRSDLGSCFGNAKEGLHF